MSGLPTVAPEAPPVSAARPCTLKDLFLYFLRLGTTGFAGPIALVGHMQRELVEHKHWFSSAEYREGLALAQLAPGPLAAQLAMYLGWARGGVWGAALVGLATVAIALVVLFVPVWLKKVPEPLLILVAGVVGVFLR